MNDLRGSDLRRRELLLASGHPSGAYYLSGYALECGLKAIIARQFRADEIPELKRVSRIYVHDLAKLVEIAGVESALGEAIATDAALNARWTIAKRWSEQSRYEIWTREQASAILDAIGGDEGLLEWLAKRF